MSKEKNFIRLNNVDLDLVNGGITDARYLEIDNKPFVLNQNKNYINAFF